MGLEQRYVLSGFRGMRNAFWPILYAQFNARAAGVVVSIALLIEIAYQASRWLGRRPNTSRSTRAHADLAE
jgi:hypothetical protein